MDAADEVEQRRLAGAVRPDQAEDLPCPDFKADFLGDHDSAEMLVHALDPDGAHVRVFLAISPDGRTNRNSSTRPV